MTRTPAALVTAALLPPLGVHLGGGSARTFWAACGLTMLGFVPGALFALATVIREAEDENGAQGRS